MFEITFLLVCMILGFSLYYILKSRKEFSMYLSKYYRIKTTDTNNGIISYTNWINFKDYFTSKIAVEYAELTKKSLDMQYPDETHEIEYQ